jgi:hypothetical protein
MSLAQIAAEINEHYRQEVYKETWGHLAPEKDVTYTFRIVYAVECYNSQGIVVLKSEYDNDLDSSPWLFDAENDFLYDLSNKLGDQEGVIYEVNGTMTNYVFDATRQIVCRF